jgi:hypothetical protein
MQPLYNELFDKFLDDIFGKNEKLSKADFTKKISKSDYINNEDLRKLIAEKKKAKDLGGLTLSKSKFEPKKDPNFFESVGQGFVDVGSKIGSTVSAPFKSEEKKEGEAPKDGATAPATDGAADGSAAPKDGDA